MILIPAHADAAKKDGAVICVVLTVAMTNSFWRGRRTGFLKISSAEHADRNSTSARPGSPGGSNQCGMRIAECGIETEASDENRDRIHN